MVMKLIEIARGKKPIKGALKKMSMESKLFLCTKLCVCVCANVIITNLWHPISFLFFWVPQIGYIIGKFKCRNI